MKNWIGFILVAVLVVFANSLFIVDESERAVLFQFGAVQRTDFKPGLHFKVPFLQNVRKFDKRVLTMNSEPERYLTSEAKDVLIDFFVKWRIADVAKFYTASSGDEQVAQQRLSPIVRKGLGKEINARLLQDVVSVERGNVMNKLLATANIAARDLGVEIVDVRIKRIELPEEVSGKVFDRMRTERTKVANGLRSLGTEAADRIRAKADRERQVILAEASRDADQMLGQAEATAAATYAKAYGQDPAFFDFYRSLEAYRKAFGDDNGVLVLDRDSEFFRHFGGARESR